jgi:dihydrofolate reductase
MIVVRDLAAALVQAQGAHEVYIIGGATLYAQTFGLVDELRVTLVHEEIPDGDTYYPEIGDGWYPTYIEPYETHSYIDYARIPPQRSVTFHGFKVI